MTCKSLPEIFKLERIRDIYFNFYTINQSNYNQKIETFLYFNLIKFDEVILKFLRTIKVIYRYRTIIEI